MATCDSSEVGNGMRIRSTSCGELEAVVAELALFCDFDVLAAGFGEGWMSLWKRARSLASVRAIGWPGRPHLTRQPASQ